MKKALLLFAFSLLTTFSVAQVDSISLNSTLSVGSLNWPDGDWYVRALLIDDMGNEIAPITDAVMFSLTSEWPSIAITMNTTAPTIYSIRFYRSQTPFNVGDNNIEFNEVGCSGTLCSTVDVSSVALSNTLNGGWNPMTVVPVELESFNIE